MIVSFADAETQRLWATRTSRRLPGDMLKRAVARLEQLHFANALDDLRIPPGNRLEALSGDRAGSHSIRVNQQWRVCFVWTDHGPAEVAIVDYH